VSRKNLDFLSDPLHLRGFAVIRGEIGGPVLDADGIIGRAHS